MENERIKCAETQHKHIYINRNRNTRSGFCYFFRMPDEYLKQKYIKASVNLDKLVQYRDNFLKENNIPL